MKKRYISLIIIIVLAIIIQLVCISITPALKTIASKEVNRFCQMIINNTPFPVELEHDDLIAISRNGDEIVAINFNTNYASSLGAKLVNQLEDLFYLIEAGTYQKEDNSFYQNKLQQMSDDGGVIATIRLGLLTDNPFLANVGPKINLKYKTISAITSTVEENIENYGVNHVMVSLKIVIKIRLMVLFPFYNEEFSHEYDYPLVMEVIEGEVPNWYQN